jgi:hypothetical protein
LYYFFTELNEVLTLSSRLKLLCLHRGNNGLKSSNPHSFLVKSHFYGAFDDVPAQWLMQKRKNIIHISSKMQLLLSPNNENSWFENGSIDIEFKMEAELVSNDGQLDLF